MTILQIEKPLLRVLAGESVRPLPFWLMRQAGRYLPEYRAVRQQANGFLSLCLTPDLATEVTLQPIRRYHPDAAILFADILLIPYGMGQPLSFVEGEGPVLEPIRSVEGLSKLDVSRADEVLAPVMQTVRNLRRELPSDVALIGFAGAPWTVATYMVEGGSSRNFEHTKAWAYGDENGFRQLMEMLVESTSRYLIAQIEAGAEVIQIFDTWAGVLPEFAFRRFCIEPTRRIVSRVRARYPAVPIMGFPRGAGMLLPDYISETGVDGVSLDPFVPAHWAAEWLQPTCTLQGNLDPVMLLTGGQPMQAEIERILSALGGDRYIFNLGHGILPQTPPEHVAQLAEIVRSWRG